MAWGVRAAQLGQRRLLCGLLTLTLLGGCGFLVVKYFEYSEKISHGLLWARAYNPQEHAPEHDAATATEPVEQAAATETGGEADAAAADDAFHPEASVLPGAGRAPGGLAATGGIHAEPPDNLWTFFSIYYLMTGLHGLHVLVTGASGSCHAPCL